MCIHTTPTRLLGGHDLSSKSVSYTSKIHLHYMCKPCVLHVYYRCMNYMCDTPNHHTCVITKDK